MNGGLLSRCARSQASGYFCLIFAHPQHRQEGLLRNVDFADPLHPLFAFLLFFQQLALAA